METVQSSTNWSTWAWMLIKQMIRATRRSFTLLRVVRNMQYKPSWRKEQISHRNLRQETALFSAARFGRISIVKLMLENNVDPDPKNIDMKTPLLCAAKGLCPYSPRREDWDVAKNSRVVSLLDADADANPQRSLDSKSSTSENQLLAPLLYTVKGGYSDLIKALLNKGTQVYLSPRQRADIPALVIVAAKSGKKDILEFLMVEHSVSPETKSTALLFAMSNKEVETARFLLHHGVKATLLTGKAQSALHFAVFCGDKRTEWSTTTIFQSPRQTETNRGR
ncbi:ankyrin [Aspergillus eucalypticola CBS 122712]|uniref:Ankyrin n=1 Tax=Aspergillus eucalypticola (strain CBS 122712 / IBT 29274) TaxID=1448314 RepID=A0A317WBY8_ASPEC|nr:ankyrin [Aspergillus eucalypticola CBS 122712]PWY82558.1 ankyrin [Aspergillus eucalypticola CBS 122712]